MTPIDVASILKKNGFELDKRKIEIAEPIRNLGSYKIKIRLAEGIQPVITLHVKKKKSDFSLGTCSPILYTNRNPKGPF